MMLGRSRRTNVVTEVLSATSARHPKQQLPGRMLLSHVTFQNGRGGERGAIGRLVL